jgi:hypothetical protein
LARLAALRVLRVSLVFLVLLVFNNHLSLLVGLVTPSCGDIIHERVL